jgi:hypothetical protein
VPQLEFVGFHYIIHAFGSSYLFVYVIVTLFLLKPIFKEFFFLPTLPAAVVLEVMLLDKTFSEKVLFSVTKWRTPSLISLQKQEISRWD